MLPGWLLFLISAGYVGLLFAIASWGDLRAERRAASQQARSKPWVYSLGLAVYCTSWTFYGAVGRAATHGWDFLPIYLGPILVFGLATPMVRRIVQVSRRHNLTSVADFIGARYGRRQELAALVALIAVIGVLPYLALQLKAVAVSLGALATPDPQPIAPLDDTALITSMLLAVFAILFGTRHVASTENHHGLMLAIAFESGVKLLAFVAVGAFAAWGVFNGLGEAYHAADMMPAVQSTLGEPSWTAGFIAQTVLAMAAILCLPRQFHVTVVENSDASDLRTARWLFPLYLAVISVFVLPIAAAGTALLGQRAVLPDSYVLNVPLATGHPHLALLAYIGGFSAATSMVIVETVALSTMLSNELVTPLLLRSRRLGLVQRPDLSGLVKSVRRASIVVLLALAYLYNRNFTGAGSLASIGLLSFAAVLQFAPALVGGVYWKRGSHQGVLAGLVGGFTLWGYTLLLPALLGADSSFVQHGPLGLAWLRPYALFGAGPLDAITHGTLWSLLANLVGYVGGSLLFPAGLRERLHAARYIEDAGVAPAAEVAGSTATVGDIEELLERFFGAERTAEMLNRYAATAGRSAPGTPRERASADLVRHTERLLAGALGASSARVMVASMLRGRDMELEDVIRLLDETSHALQFSRELMQAALEHLAQGVSVVDGELRLVAWNRRYVELFGYPKELVTVGRPIEDLVRFNASQGLLGPGDVEALVQRRLVRMRAGSAYSHERELPGGTVIEIRGNPMPGGGFVTTYADISAYKHAERRLQELAETLEQRVQARTQELSRLNNELSVAKSDAERANAAKTRFLAAASHDLVQPISAARLFLAAFDRRGKPAGVITLVQNVETALGAAEKLLAGLLDISRLDAGAQPVQRKDFRLSSVLEPLAIEFNALAAERGLEFRYAPSRVAVRSDPALLRRVVQNFLSNALRYTGKGRVLLGARRVIGGMRVEVWDTGPGIPAERHAEIFEEFRRLDTRAEEKGLGLGLAIADRIARLLGHRMGVRSRVGQGSVFHITVPLGNAAHVEGERPRTPRPAAFESGPRVLCIENEPAVLAGMETLLKSWGCRVVAAQGLADAREACTTPPDVALVDYHLDGADNGIAALETLRRHWGVDVPGVVITADHTPAAREAATAHGYGFLQKPIKPAALRA
ncbi:MAG TPA: NahK/ErcS family hybrid sensor histidine kinase/response regulator, partial [Candidatus Binatia bacterium]|nr:NahK/ErcS family hybrid sensor histidine kinase/response regulator [Candidatus Binatia bacterium]